MKKILFVLLILNGIVFAQNTPVDFFKSIDLSKYKREEITLEKKSIIDSSHVIYYDDSGKDFFLKTCLYSSIGKTYYLVYEKKTNVYLIKKESWFYKEPFITIDADIEESFFIFDGTLKFFENNEIKDNAELAYAEAVIDYKSAVELINDYSKCRFYMNFKGK